MIDGVVLVIFMFCLSLRKSIWRKILQQKNIKNKNCLCSYLGVNSGPLKRSNALKKKNNKKKTIKNIPSAPLSKQKGEVSRGINLAENLGTRLLSGR